MPNNSTKIKQKQIDKAIYFYRNNQFQEAKEEALRLLKKDSNHVQILILLCVLSKILKEKAKEKEYLLKLTVVNPNEPAVFNDLGNFYSTDNEYIKAKKMFERAIKIAPDYVPAYCGLGLAFKQEDDFTHAEEMYKRAILLDEKCSEAYNNLGILYKDIFASKKAEEMYLLAIHHSPEHTSAYGNLATLYADKKEYLLADDMFKKSLTHNPDDVELSFNYALFCLENMDYIKGFNLYRYRYHARKKDNHILHSSAPGLLQKGDDLKNKTLLITHEQGYGDFIQFMRYIPLFEALCAKVYVLVEPLLLRIFQNNYPNIAFIPANQGLTLQYNYRMPLLDAAYILGTEYETIPTQETYLTVNVNDSKIVYDKYFKNTTKKKIGIVWRTNGNKDEPIKVQADRKKQSCTLDDFLRYFNNDAVQLYSLQFGATDEERITLKNNNIPSLGDDFIDFYDNALVIDNLDVIIGIETASLLIAGAMGKETIVLLADKCTWIWGTTNVTTNWFKSIKLIRQNNLGDWDSLFKKASCEFFMGLAVNHHTTGDLNAAEYFYRKVLELDPIHADAYHYLGVIAFSLGDVKHAIGLIQEAIRLNPQLDEAFMNLKKIVSSLKSIV